MPEARDETCFGLFLCPAETADFSDPKNYWRHLTLYTIWCNYTTDAVKVLLGRSSDKGLEVYGRPDERRVIGELEQSAGYQKDTRKAS